METKLQNKMKIPQINDKVKIMTLNTGIPWEYLLIKKKQRQWLHTEVKKETKSNKWLKTEECLQIKQKSRIRLRMKKDFKKRIEVLYSNMYTLVAAVTACCPLT